MGDYSHHHNHFATGQPVLDRLVDAGAPEAGLDANARYPPPKCHPGSRRTIKAKLETWLFNCDQQQRMFWLYGPAGVGKSAVAQTFAELARDHKRLGAAHFFFSDDEKRSDPLRLIPSLAYQLAVLNEHYKRALTHLLANDPAILYAALHLQFQKLIIDPFSLLVSHPEQATECPYLIVVDSLDECSDEQAQCKLVQLINDAAQRNNLPLIWLVCSRPESHIKRTFSKPDSGIICNREELIIDDETREDVEQYLRHSFKEIYTSYSDVITVPRDGCWPPQDVFDIISQASSGLFVFASTVIRVAGDPNVGDPDAQLKSLSGMLKGLNQIGIQNPLQALDIFYTRILSKVVDSHLPIVIHFLGFCLYSYGHTVQGIASLYPIERGVFYSTMQKLHSVVKVPPPEDTAEKFISIYHKSFRDYLEDPCRSGKYHPSWARFATTTLAKGIPLYNHFLTCKYPDRVPPEELARSQSIVRQWSFTGEEMSIGLWILGRLRHAADTATCFAAVREFNFGLVEASGYPVPLILEHAICDDWNTGVDQDFVRTHAVDEPTDSQLLHHLSILANGNPIKPINITCKQPVGGLKGYTMGYAILGRGSKSCLICLYRHNDTLEFRKTIHLDAQLRPTTDQISEFREWEKEIESHKVNHGAPCGQAGWEESDGSLAEEAALEESYYETCSDGSE
ncbi:hypothetical protein P691DRAFT_754481 [Macrolepiota fuliginosa MF-IS2]|uniref:Nephrocystin 3-like N-terminal domain-containing protein n=1 Tax=Macrolepiota fuliginosa MF-IS2 TaxID=1400762 RepID=A0A9P5XRW1_9AGAR|nr:hypothetical protein P691DRAFT_754481 [Macrolepiota fuliginosa MF-IS2]